MPHTQAPSVRPASDRRADWKGRGVDTYLAPAGCTDKSRPPGVSLETTFDELRDVRADLRCHGARRTVDREHTCAELRSVRDRLDAAAKPPAVFWCDSGDPPQAGACCGAPSEILRRLGARNIFADTPGSWAPVSWEAVIARNPDVVVLARRVVVDCRREAQAVALGDGRWPASRPSNRNASSRSISHARRRGSGTLRQSGSSRRLSTRTGSGDCPDAGN